MNVEYLHKTFDTEFVAKANQLITNSYSKNKKLTRKDFVRLKKIFDRINKDKDNKEFFDINIPEFGIENEFFEIELTQEYMN